jgi:hypothetical protein
LRILEVERFDEQELLTRLAGTQLRGHGGARVYQDADLQLCPPVHPDALAPAQRYVLEPGVRRILALREALLPHGLDMFALEGGAFVRTSHDPDAWVPVIPPVVEESHEPDGRTVFVINDGIHRAYAARSIGQRIAVVLATDVPHEYPYYALALPGGWNEVEALDELPDTYQKKEYRQPDNYKALFREFNAVFPGVQADRKATNPEYLRA